MMGSASSEIAHIYILFHGCIFYSNFANNQLSQYNQRKERFIISYNNYDLCNEYIKNQGSFFKQDSTNFLEDVVKCAKHLLMHFHRSWTLKNI